MSVISSLDQFNFYHTLAAAKGPSLVYFTAPNCGACRYLGNVLEQMLKSNPGFWVFKVDAQQDPALVQEYEVFHLPSMFLFIDGEFHCELYCEASDTAIRQAIKAASQQPAQEAP